jgi:hypothetical protein
MKSAPTLLAALIALATPTLPAAETVRFLNYPNAIVLSNDSTRVVLCPDAGGRVLEYSLHGVNALHLDEAESNWSPDAKRPMMSAGRFDIGPEYLIPKRTELWSGPWNGKLTGKHSARLTSVEHEATGVQLIRDFELATESSRLTCTQTIRNITSDRTIEWCHWSRTFAAGGGIVYVPVSATSRFPHHYVMYEGRGLINARPEDPHIRQRDGMLEILAAPAFPKLGMDSMVGWLACQGRNDLLFVKRFPTYPDRVYNEVAGLTISVWYPQDKPVIELEPIGPRERLRPGESASFTETWDLLESPWPENPNAVDLDELRAKVQALE